MPIFEISNKKLLPVEQTNFFTEKDLQSLIETGTGDFEITVTSNQDLEVAKEFINLGYQKVGG